MSTYKDLSKVRFTAWIVGIIMIARWFVIFGSTLFKNKVVLADTLTDTIAIVIVVALIFLGTRIENNIKAPTGHLKHKPD